MKEFLTKLLNQLNEVTKKLNTNQKIIIAVILVLVLLSFVLLISYSSKSDKAILYSDLNAKDFGEITKKLQEWKKEFTPADNKNIWVKPEDKEYIKMKLAQEGLIPTGIKGWDLFDTQKWTTTDFERNVNLRRAVEGQMIKHLKSLKEDIEDVSIEVTMPAKELYIDEDVPWKASVIITPAPYSDIINNKKKIKGIINLVSFGIDKLKSENIVVSDNRGNVLSDFSDDEKTDYLMRAREETKIIEQLRSKLQNDVYTGLGKFIGKDKVDVRVFLDVDFNQEEMEKKEYVPTELKKDNPATPYDESMSIEKIVRSEKDLSEKFQGYGYVPEGPPGVDENYPPGYKEASDKYGKYEKNENIKNYEIGEQKSVIKRMPYLIKKVSVAVWVDGIWKKVYDDASQLVMNYLKKILKNLGHRKNISYEELNNLLPPEVILEEHIEDILDFCSNNNISIQSGRERTYTMDKDYKRDIIIDNLIDTPDKFYFYELNKNKKITLEKEKKLLNELSSTKDKIKNLMIDTDFFLFELFRDITRSKTTGAINFLFDSTDRRKSRRDDLQSGNIIHEIKTLFKQYAGNKKEPEDKVQLMSYLQKYNFKFPYIIEKIKLLKHIQNEIIDPKTGDLAKILKKVRRKKINTSLIDQFLPELNYLFKKYNHIKEQIVHNHLPLVLSIVKHYFDENCNYNDLIQEGNTALIEALDYYDHRSHKKKFYEFVSSLIRNKVKKYMEKNKSLITVSHNFHKECKFFLKTVRELKNRLMRMPSMDEIKIKLNWPDNKIISVISFLQKEESLEKEDYYTNLSLKGSIVDNSQKLPDEVAIEKILKEQIMDMIDRLPEREKFIIKMRFGFNDENTTYDYKEIAKKLQLTELEIKDIEAHSLKKLRVLFQQNNMEEFM